MGNTDYFCQYKKFPLFFNTRPNSVSSVPSVAKFTKPPSPYYFLLRHSASLKLCRIRLRAFETGTHLNAIKLSPFTSGSSSFSKQKERLTTMKSSYLNGIRDAPRIKAGAPPMNRGNHLPCCLRSRFDTSADLGQPPLQVGYNIVRVLQAHG